MKRFFLAVACVAGLALATGTASAQAPVQGVVTGNCSHCSTPAHAHGSLFSRLAFWKSGSCSTCGHSSGLRSWTNNASGMTGGGGLHAAPYNAYPQGVPGTLVFPQHPFVRSPRDFFMTER